MREVAFESWSEFEQAVGNLAGTPILDTDDEVIFRGHAEVPLDPLVHGNGRWLLQSQYERGFVRMRAQLPLLDEATNFDSDFALSKRFDPFKQAILQVNPESTEWTDFQFWAFGRHYGLVTRLLDWTRSPFIAGFFAFEAYLCSVLPGINAGWFAQEVPSDPQDRLVGSVSIWALRQPNDLACDDFIVHDENPPEPLATRQRAQQGLFTELRTTEAYDLEHYFTQRESLDYLTRYTVPGAEAAVALNALSERGVSYRTVFPDPEGCAREANLPGQWGHKW